MAFKEIPLQLSSYPEASPTTAIDQAFDLLRMDWT